MVGKIIFLREKYILVGSFTENPTLPHVLGCVWGCECGCVFKFMLSSLLTVGRSSTVLGFKVTDKLRTFVEKIFFMH